MAHFYPDSAFSVINRLPLIPNAHQRLPTSGPLQPFPNFPNTLSHPGLNNLGGLAPIPQSCPLPTPLGQLNPLRCNFDFLTLDLIQRFTQYSLYRSLYSNQTSPPARPPTSSNLPVFSSPISPLKSSTISPPLFSSDNSPHSSDTSNKTTSPSNFNCENCGRHYATQLGLTKHRCLQRNSSTSSNVTTSPTITSTTPSSHVSMEVIGSDNASTISSKAYSCQHCDKAYFSLSALKMHIRTHTLPCRCQLCGKAFSRMWLLQGHLRTHTGERPFRCEQCGRAFADRSNLRAHMQTHSAEKKYKCHNCPKSFSRMGLLVKHRTSGCQGGVTHRGCSPTMAATTAKLRLKLQDIITKSDHSMEQQE